MALTKITVRRATVTDAGTDFLTLEDVSNRVAQAVGVVDENGDHAGIAANPLVVSSGSPATTQSQSGAAPVASFVLSVVPTRLLELRAMLAAGTINARYVMLFDAIATPANGTVPDWTMLVPGAGEASESFSVPLAFATGLSIGISSTAGIYTQTPTGEAFLMAIETAF